MALGAPCGHGDRLAADVDLGVRIGLEVQGPGWIAFESEIHAGDDQVAAGGKHATAVERGAPVLRPVVVNASTG